MKNDLFDRKNLKLLLLSVALLIIGYICLGQGPVDNPLSKSVAPIILVGAYCIAIPFALMSSYKKKDEKTKKSSNKDQKNNQGV